MRTFKTFALVPLLAAFAGCTVGPAFVRPDAPAAPHFTDSGALTQSNTDAQHPEATQQRIVTDASPAEAWWEAFQSKPLNDLVQQALAHNPTLAAADATVAQAQELIRAESGSLWPRVDLSAGTGRKKYGASFFGSFQGPAPFTYFAVGPNVSYTLDLTGGIGRSIEARRAQAAYQEQQAAAARMSVSGNAVYLVLRIASIRDQIAAAEEIQRQDRENLRLVRIAYDNGLVSRLDILQAQSQVASDMALTPSLRQELSVSRHALAVMLGVTPDTAPQLDLALNQFVLPATLAVGQPSELAHRRPDILAAEAQLHAATAAVGIATANLYPRITLTAGISQESTSFSGLFNASSNAWSLISGLTAPIFDGGSLRAERRSAIDAMHASAANYQHVVITAFAQVADVLDALEHDAEQFTAERDARDSARESAELARRSYQEGNSTILQVLDAERLYQQASLGFVRATAQQYLDTAQLFTALGGQSPERAAAVAAVHR